VIWFGSLCSSQLNTLRLSLREFNGINLDGFDGQKELNSPSEIRYRSSLKGISLDKFGSLKWLGTF